MSSDVPNNGFPAPAPAPAPEIHVHNSFGGNKGWNILAIFAAMVGLMVIGYQLSLGPFAELVATGMTMFVVTLVGYMFKAGILRLPEKQDDDLAFTKGTMRRIYDEITAAIVKSSVIRLILFAAAYTAGFLILRAGVSSLFSMISTFWMAVGIGLLLASGIVVHDRIFAWLRTLNSKKGNK